MRIKRILKLRVKIERELRLMERKRVEIEGDRCENKLKIGGVFIEEREGLKEKLRGGGEI